MAVITMWSFVLKMVLFQVWNAEAKKITYTWLTNGNIPARINSKTPDKAQTDLDKMSWMKLLRSIDLTRDDVQHIVNVLIERKMLVSGILTAEPGSTPIVPFLYEFWSYKTSPYYKEKKVLGQELSHNYCPCIAPEFRNAQKVFYFPGLCCCNL